MKSNAHTAKLEQLMRSHRTALSQAEQNASLEARKIANEYEAKLDKERTRLQLVTESHTQQVHELHTAMQQQQQEHHSVLTAVKDEHKSQLSREVERVGQEHHGRLAEELTALSDRKDAEHVSAKAALSNSHEEILSAAAATHREDVAFYEDKIEKLEAGKASGDSLFKEAAAQHAQHVQEILERSKEATSSAETLKDSLHKSQEQLRSMQVRGGGGGGRTTPTSPAAGGTTAERSCALLQKNKPSLRPLVKLRASAEEEGSLLDSPII
jgi:hypothetical protein